MSLLKSYIQFNLFVAIVSINFFGQSFASDDLCDIEIEGATVNMSSDEFITMMTAKGLHKRAENKRHNYKHTFTSSPPGAQQAPGDYAVTWSRSRDGITIRVQYYKSDRGAQIFQERINRFCPNNKPVRSTELTCVGKTRDSINLISKYPKDLTNFPYCSYGGGYQGPNISESVSLTLQNSNKVREVTKKDGKKTFIKGR